MSTPTPQPPSTPDTEPAPGGAMPREENPPRLVKTRTVFQMTATECGAASLTMILAFYGRDVPLETVREECGVGRDGASVAGIKAGAAAEGLTLELHATSAAAAQHLPTPFIAYWKHRHFLVVEGHDRKGWHLNDPATGRRTIPDDEWNRGYSNYAMVLSPGPGFQRRSTFDRSFFASLLRPMKGSWLPLVLVLLTGFLLLVPGVLLPAFAAVFIDSVLVAHNPQWLRGIVLGLVAIGLFAAALRILSSFIMMHLSMPLRARLHASVLWRTLRMPVTFFDMRPVGGLMTRIGKVDAIEDLLVHKFPAAILSGATMVVMLIAVTWRSLPLAGIAVAAAVLELASLRLVTRIRNDASQQIQAQRFELSGWEMTGLRDMDTIRAQGAADQFLDTLMSRQATVLTARQRLARVTEYYKIVPNSIHTMTSLALLFGGAFEVMAGNLTVGSAVACMMLTNKFLKPIFTFLGLGEELQTTRAVVDQLNDIVATPTDPVFNLPEQTLREFSGDVAVQGVNFGYNRTTAPILQDIDLDIPAGSRVAIVGRSGCGKSTLANLICGELQPWQGSIQFDGVNCDAWPRAVLTTQVAKVAQNPFLFEGTVDENVRLWDPGIDESAVLEGLTHAQALTFTGARGGLNAAVTEEGRNFSGGQVQRLELARALARNPSVLILDEATSALDTETESAVLAALAERGCTTISIAHRLSTIRDSDAIVVLDQGRIVAQGTHSELLAAGGLYAELVGHDQ